MAISRGTLPADSFTIISNAWLRDPTVSLKVKGLLAYVASHAAGYRLTLEQIVAETKDGIDAVRATIADARDAGYLRTVDVRNERGHRIGTDFELLEPPARESPSGETPTGTDQGERDVSAGQAQLGKSQVGKSDPKKTTPPAEDKKTTEKTPSASPRGTRLPEGWQPDSKLGAWLLAKLPEDGWTEHSKRWALHETEKFTLYWHAKAGAAARHVDWDRTWQRWMMTALERYRPAVAGLKTPPAGEQFKTAAEKTAAANERRKVRGLLLDALVDQGMAFGAAVPIVDAELKRREDAGQAITMDACPVLSYIDGNVIDTTTTTTREVTA